MQNNNCSPHLCLPEHNPSKVEYWMGQAIFFGMSTEEIMSTLDRYKAALAEIAEITSWDRDISHYVAKYTINIARKALNKDPL